MSEKSTKNAGEGKDASKKIRIERTKTKDTNGIVVGEFETHYDEEGRVVKRFDCNPESPLYTAGKEYKYDSAGRKIAEADISEEGRMDGLKQYFYDSNGRLIKKITSHEVPEDSFHPYDGKYYNYHDIEEFVYNDKGELIDTILTHRKDKVEAE